MTVIYVYIDKTQTGDNIWRLMQESGISARELQEYMGFASIQAVYHWKQGINLPSIDSLLVLSHLWDIPVNEIIVYRIIESP